MLAALQVMAKPETASDAELLNLKTLSDERAAKWPDTLQVCLALGCSLCPQHRC